MKSLNTITTRLLMLVLFITLIPLVVQLNLSTNIIKNSTDDVKNFQLDLISDIVQNKFYGLKNDLEKSVIQTSVFLGDENLGITKGLSNEKLAYALGKANVLHQNNYFLVFNASGRVIAATENSGELLKNINFKALLKEIKQGRVVSYLDYWSLNELQDHLAFYAMSPIYSDQGMLRYILVGIKVLDNEIPDFIKGFTGNVVHIYRLKNGIPQIIASNSYSYNGERDYKTTIGTDTLTVIKQNQSYKISEMYAHMLLFSKYIPIENFRGNIIGILHIGLDETKFDKLVNDNIFVFAIISVSSLLVAITLAALFARSITTPILKLVGITKEVSIGNLNQDMDVKGTFELKQLATSLTKMIQDIDTEQKIKDDFVAALTHDLKVPILAANHTINYLLNKTYGDITAEQQEVLEIMWSTNKSSLEMINNLLEVYRYDAGIKGLNLSKVDVCKVIESCIDELKHLVQEKQLSLQFDVGQAGSFVYADELGIKRVMMNLLSNSINNSLAGGCITCSIRKNDFMERLYYPKQSDVMHTSLQTPVDLSGKLLIKIQDNGVGMEKEDIEIVFKRFTSAKGRKPTGAGLGLYCTYLIIQQHSCDIWLESCEGKGTSIYFTLNQWSA